MALYSFDGASVPSWCPGGASVVPGWCLSGFHADTRCLQRLGRILVALRQLCWRSVSCVLVAFPRVSLKA